MLGKAIPYLAFLKMNMSLRAHFPDTDRQDGVRINLLNKTEDCFDGVLRLRYAQDTVSQ